MRLPKYCTFPSDVTVVTRFILQSSALTVVLRYIDFAGLSQYDIHPSHQSCVAHLSSRSSCLWSVAIIFSWSWMYLEEKIRDRNDSVSLNQIRYHPKHGTGCPEHYRRPGEFCCKQYPFHANILIKFVCRGRYLTVHTSTMLTQDRCKTMFTTGVFFLVYSQLAYAGVCHLFPAQYCY